MTALLMKYIMTRRQRSGNSITDSQSKFAQLQDAITDIDQKADFTKDAEHVIKGNLKCTGMTYLFI